MDTLILVQKNETHWLLDLTHIKMINTRWNRRDIYVEVLYKMTMIIKITIRSKLFFFFTSLTRSALWTWTRARCKNRIDDIYSIVFHVYQCSVSLFCLFLFSLYLELDVCYTSDTYLCIVMNRGAHTHWTRKKKLIMMDVSEIENCKQRLLLIKRWKDR